MGPEVAEKARAPCARWALLQGRMAVRQQRERGQRVGGEQRQCIYHEETLDLMDGEHVLVSVVFDRQARPHLIVMCRSLDGERCGCEGTERPSYWHLRPQAEAKLFEFQLSCMRKVAEELSLPEGSLWAEIHLGSWVSSGYVHSHIVLPARAYLSLKTQYEHSSGGTCFGAWQAWHARHRTYLESERRRREKWFNGDAAEAKAAAHAAAEPARSPELEGDVRTLGVVVSPDTPVFDVTLPTADSLVVLDNFCKPKVGGCFYLIPFQRRSAEDGLRVRVICPPGDFAKAFKPPDGIEQWYDKFSLERGAQWIEAAYATLGELA